MCRTWRSMIWQFHSITPGSFLQRRTIAIAALIDPNGLRSSWDSIARYSLALRFASTMSRIRTLIGVHGFQDIDSSVTELPAVGRIVGVNINRTTRYLVRDGRDVRYTVRQDQCHRSGNN